MNAPAPALPPQRLVIDGRYARLEPMRAQHVADFYAAAAVPDAADRFRYLPIYPPESVEEVRAWVEAQQGIADPMLFAVVDRASGRTGGRQSLMRIVPEHGTIEIGHVYWGPAISRTRIATEALYLFARYVFDTLGYRRFEWKCNDLNAPSRAAALRFGFQFEGVFRQHMIVKGENRDTAWFSMLDGDWPAIKAEYDRWLDPANFNSDGAQLTKLRF